MTFPINIFINNHTNAFYIVTSLMFDVQVQFEPLQSQLWINVLLVADKWDWYSSKETKLVLVEFVDNWLSSGHCFNVFILLYRMQSKYFYQSSLNKLSLM